MLCGIADCPDEIQLTVVTRLGCIPVQGVRVQCMVREKTSTNPLGISTFDIHGDKIDIVLTYANEDARMKTETVHIDSECGSNSAYFTHFIPKIRDIMDHGNEDGNIDKDDLPADFEDKYIVNAEEELNKSEPIIYESSFEIVKEDNRYIYKFRVCLATFSLDVPYINQNYGMVRKQIEDGKAKCVIESWNYEEYLENNIWEGEHPVELKTNPWIGDVLCAPTSATMILMYYGIFPMSSEGNALDMRYENRAALMTRFFNKESTSGKEPWETHSNMIAIIDDILKRSKYNNYQMSEQYSKIIDKTTGINFKTQMEHNNLALLDILRKGHPLYASIIGGHLIVVRGVVVSKEINELWAICNDPYGSLAGKKSDYSKHTHYDAWYSGETCEDSKQSNPGTREMRNTSSKCNKKYYATKGLHVYYNQTIHSIVKIDNISQKIYKFAYFEFNRAYAILPYYNHERIKDNRDFVISKLLKGK